MCVLIQYDAYYKKKIITSDKNAERLHKLYRLFYDIGFHVQQKDTGYGNQNIYFIAKLRVLNFFYTN